MNRRIVLKSLVAAPILAFLGGGRIVTMSFHVAGVRYHHPTRAPVRGDRVELRPVRFRGRDALAIFAADEQLGFVPYRLVARLRREGVTCARVAAVSPHALPWQRYVLSISLG